MYVHELAPSVHRTRLAEYRRLFDARYEWAIIIDPAAVIEFELRAVSQRRES